MNSIQKLWVALIAVAIVAVLGLFTPAGPAARNAISTFGGVTNSDEVDATAIKIGGSSGSRLGPIIESTCSLIAPSFSVAASTTVPMDCAITGLVSGDYIIGWFGSSTGQTSNGWQVTGYQASSTAGFGTFSVTNNTGASAVIPSKFASSTTYLASHPVTSVPGL